MHTLVTAPVNAVSFSRASVITFSRVTRFSFAIADERISKTEATIRCSLPSKESKALPPDTVILPGHHYVKECASVLSKEIAESAPFAMRLGRRTGCAALRHDSLGETAQPFLFQSSFMPHWPPPCLELSIHLRFRSGSNPLRFLPSRLRLRRSTRSRTRRPIRQKPIPAPPSTHRRGRDKVHTRHHEHRGRISPGGQCDGHEQLSEKAGFARSSVRLFESLPFARVHRSGFFSNSRFWNPARFATPPLIKAAGPPKSIAQSWTPWSGPSPSRFFVGHDLGASDHPQASNRN